MNAVEADAGTNSQQQRMRRERWVLTLVLVGLLATTAVVSPLAFHDLSLLFLLVAPFAVALIVSAFVAPLAYQATDARADISHAAALQHARHEEAARHAIRTPRADTLPPTDPAALAEAAAAATRDHGIHFGCTHLADEDFLQAFHACEIRAADFRHGDHLRYTALMLRRVPGGLVEETIARNLRTFLRLVCGSEALFHTTRTHAWVAVLRALPRGTFANLLARHAATLRGDSLSRFYSEDLLNSDAARQRTVTPDREPLPQAPINSRM